MARSTSRSRSSPRSRRRRTDAEHAREILERSQADPAWFGREVLGLWLWSKQVEILEAIRDHRQVAVRSCHGVSKTHTAAIVVLWFLLSWPRSRVITTATTWRQVEKLLWHEIQQQYRGARFPLGGRLLQTELKLEDGRYAIGLSSKPEEAEAFAGHHAPRLLQVFDEASGVHPKIYEAAEGHMTSAGAKRLLIGNPTRTAGEFYDAFHRNRASYRLIHIGYQDAPAFSGERVPQHVADALLSRGWVEDKIRKWGEESPLFHVRVLGDFPAQSEDTVIDLGAVEDAQARELVANPRKDSIVIGCDVARFGSDETVIAVKVGDRIRIREAYVGKPTTETAGRVGAIAREFPPVAVRIVVDDDGVGGGVTDILREQGFEVTPFNGGATAIQSNDYPNRRSELWFVGSERMPELDLDEDDQLAADLTAPEYAFDSHGRRVVERKAETKKRLGRSPDRGDAVLLTLVHGGAIAPVTAPTSSSAAPPMDGILTEPM